MSFLKYINERSLSQAEKDEMRKDALKMNGNDWSKKWPIGDYEDYKLQARRAIGLDEDNDEVSRLEIVQLLNKTNINAIMGHLDKITGEENKGRVQEVRSFLKLLQNNVDNLTSTDNLKIK